MSSSSSSSSSSSGNVDKSAMVLMSQCMTMCAKEVEIRAVTLFGKEGLNNPDVQRLLDTDTASFRWANAYGLGAAVTGGAASFMVSRSWWLIARVPFVGITSLSICGPIGFLYGTKQMVDTLLRDANTPCATAKILCPSLERLQPCMDDWACSSIMRKDFGGGTMLSWRDLCKARPMDQAEIDARQEWGAAGGDGGGWGEAVASSGAASAPFR